MRDLFDVIEPPAATRHEIAPGAVLLPGRALAIETEILGAVEAVVAEAPFRHMTTPGGFLMSVAMTSCGALGWITDRTGYRYATHDPETRLPWPAMPSRLLRLAAESAAVAGFPGFRPDTCLINRYEPGAKMGLHQDKDEPDLNAPIVSVSLGLPATFQFGGPTRKDRPVNLPLRHGDVVVWGGPARLAFHGVLTLKDGDHPLVGRRRINLTFRKAG